MKNKSPIFLNCFSRGGSNILWNVFLSHPDVCSPILETLQIFGAGIRHASMAGYKIALLSRQPKLFDQWNLQERKSINPKTERLIDRTFFQWKMKTLQDGEMKFKFEGEIYAQQEIEIARLAAKNNNGLVFLSDILLEMYPQATFFGLVRHPLALYESHRRRDTPPSRSLEDFASFYNTMVSRMLADCEIHPGYHLVRFEDLLADPGQQIPRLYEHAGLDPKLVKKMRFKAKPHMQKDGGYQTPYQEGHHYWFEPDQLHLILDPGVNDYQIQRLHPAERETMLDQTSEVCMKLGYKVTGSEV